MQTVQDWKKHRHLSNVYCTDWTWSALGTSFVLFGDRSTNVHTKCVCMSLCLTVFLAFFALLCFPLSFGLLFLRFSLCSFIYLLICLFPSFFAFLTSFLVCYVSWMKQVMKSKFLKGMIKILITNSRFITVFTTACHWSLSRARWIQSTSSHTFPKIHSNIILSFTSKSLKLSLPFSLSDQSFVLISHLSNACYTPRSSHPPWFGQL
jgi:hypothetical protein